MSDCSPSWLEKGWGLVQQAGWLCGHMIGSVKQFVLRREFARRQPVDIICSHLPACLSVWSDNEWLISMWLGLLMDCSIWPPLFWKRTWRLPLGIESIRLLHLKEFSGLLTSQAAHTLSYHQMWECHAFEGAVHLHHQSLSGWLPRQSACCSHREESWEQSVHQISEVSVGRHTAPGWSRAVCCLDHPTGTL